jgi:hypothetical protein
MASTRINRKRSASPEEHEPAELVSSPAVVPMVEDDGDNVEAEATLTKPTAEQAVPEQPEKLAASSEPSSPPSSSAERAVQTPECCGGCCCHNRRRKRNRQEASPEPSTSVQQQQQPQPQPQPPKVAVAVPTLPPPQPQMFPPQPPPTPSAQHQSPFASVRVDVTAPVGLLYQMANAARIISEHVRHKTVTVAEMMHYASLTLFGIVVLMKMLPRHLMDMALFLLLIVCITVTFLMRADQLVRQPAPPPPPIKEAPTVAALPTTTTTTATAATKTSGDKKCINRERLLEFRRQQALTAAQ